MTPPAPSAPAVPSPPAVPSAPPTPPDGRSPRLLVIAGPTGTGKSDLAIAVAQRVGGEVINADSMQTYRGMDIGTAKVTAAQRASVPHHLLDIWDVTETASVALYQRLARERIEALLAAGITPILVGGSGLYIQAVIDEIDFPGTDPQVRARYLQRLEREGPEALHAELARLDPPAAKAVLPSNGRRIVRALEVIEITGKPFTANLPAPGPARYDAGIVTVDRDPVELDQRLEQRVEVMMRNGFADEVRALLNAGLRDGVTARRALGYAQLIDAIDGRTSLEQAAADTVTATRRFVRRQRSWFRRDPRRHQLDGADPALLDRTLRLLHG